MTRTAILITGAGSGIGAAIARALAAPEVSLLLHTGSNEAALQAVAAEARAKGATVETMLGDLTDPALAPALVETARTRFGGLDKIVSNAGRAQKSQFGEVTAADLTAAFDMMALAFFRLADAALPLLRASREGRIVAISSFVAHAYGTNGLLFPATSAAKAALEALAKSLAYQLGPDGVTVNCVAPGFVRKDATGHAATTRATMDSATQITPNRRIGLPEDIASMVRYLLQPEALHITGQVFHVDGGLLLP